MLKKISTVLLSVTIAVFTAFQAQGAETKTDRSEVRVLPQADVQVESGKKIGGEIRITAALREMQSREDITVKFTLAGDRHTYETTVIVTPDSEDEEGLLSATASFENLLSGAYQLYIEAADGASLDYILAEKGGESKYTMQEDSITFYLSEAASSGSAWFMMQEEMHGREHGGPGDERAAHTPGQALPPQRYAPCVSPPSASPAGLDSLPLRPARAAGHAHARAAEQRKHIGRIY